ncbi:MAG: FtsX-like permease family protein, partial [Firmicutes bacterium]|nr:FtsX-like permease family protein [Bacillota bacterium]
IKKAYQELEELPDAEWTILRRDSHYSTYMFKNNAKQMGSIGISLPVLFYLVAALVCMTTMTRLVDEQRGQIGVFRALGFTKNQVIGKYVLYALLATTVGSALGIVIGMAIFPTVIYNTWRLMYDLPAMQLVVPVKNIFICFAAFSVLMSVVTYFVVKKSLDEAPSQLMRPKAPKNAKKIFLEYFTSFWNRLSFTSKITARNLVRYKSRFIMTVIGVAGCTGLLVVGWGIKDSIAGIVSIQYGELFNFNHSVYVEETADIERFVNVLSSNLDNEYVAPSLQYASKVYLDKDEPTINVVVLDARDANDILRLRKTDKETEIKLKNNGVIVSEKFANNNGIKKGDYITIESEEGIKASVKVTEICEMYFQHYAFISDEYYYTVFGEHPHHKIIYVKNEVSEEFVRDIENMDGYESIVDFSSMIDQFNKMIEALDFIILVIILTAGSLAFVVLINLTQVNISERIREIATLKVLGFRKGEVSSYISKEIFLLSLIGGVMGIPLGILEHHFIMNVINMDMIMFSNKIKFPTFIYAFGITILFTIIVLIMTRRPLRKVEMIESLKSVE